MNKNMFFYAYNVTLTQLFIGICEKTYIYMARCYNRIYKDDIAKFIDYEAFGMNEAQFLEQSKIALINLIEQDVIVADGDFFYKLNPALRV